MIVVVATGDDEAAALSARVTALGATIARVVAPGGDRRLVLAHVNDEFDASRIVSTLRVEGSIAVTRPDDGVRLDAWRQHTAPITFDTRLSVCFAWAEHNRTLLPGLVELGLGGFGSGEHATTRLLVEQLLQRVHGSERVLDVGCGSGVLGLCAVRLGADEVVAVDIKPEAVEATRQNAALNGMTSRMRATNSPLATLDGAFGVVLGNIARAAIVELAPQLVRLLAPGGWLAVSGISPPQCDQVAAFLRPLVEIDRRTSGDWSALVLGHP